MNKRLLIGLGVVIAALAIVGCYLFERAGPSLNVYADRDAPQAGR